METKVNYTIVGAFVIFLLALITVGIVWLATGFSAEEYSFYKVYMQEAVTGLSTEEPVEFNGVAVGTIKSIKINTRNPQIVELLLKIKSSTPITQGTVAKLSIRGVTGITFISLEDKGTDLKPLEKLPGELYPFIRTEPSILVRLDTTLTQINESFRQMSASIKAFLNKENLQSIRQILHSGKGSMRLIETQTLPSANEAATNLNKITRNLEEMSSEIKQNPAILIRGKASQELGPGEQ